MCGGGLRSMRLPMISCARFGSFDSGGGYAVNHGDEDGGTYEVRDGLVIFQPGDGSMRRAMAAFRSDEHVLIGDLFLEGTAR